MPGMRTTKCRSCGAEIGFIKTQKGKTMPVDAASVWITTDPEGIPFVLADGSVVKAKQVEGPVNYSTAQESGYQIGYVSHFATCPDAALHRKPRKSERKKG